MSKSGQGKGGSRRQGRYRGGVSAKDAAAAKFNDEEARLEAAVARKKEDNVRAAKMEQDDIARKAKADADAAALAEATKLNRIKVEALKTIDGGDVGGATLLCNDLGIVIRRKTAEDAL